MASVVADMSGSTDLRRVSEDPVVRGAQDSPPAVRTRPQRAARGTAVPRENGDGRSAGRTTGRPGLVQETLSGQAAQILRRLVRTIIIIVIIIQGRIKASAGPGAVPKCGPLTDL